jgi:hypothetical protein
MDLCRRFSTIAQASPTSSDPKIKKKSLRRRDLEAKRRVDSQRLDATTVLIAVDAGSQKGVVMIVQNEGLEATQKGGVMIAPIVVAVVSRVASAPIVVQLRVLSQKRKSHPGMSATFPDLVGTKGFERKSVTIEVDAASVVGVEKAEVAETGVVSAGLSGVTVVSGAARNETI